MPILTILPGNGKTVIPMGTNLLDALRAKDRAPDAPCGGNGKCGKCAVVADGKEVLACQTVVDRDMAVTIPEKSGLRVLHTGPELGIKMNPYREGYFLAFDIGTTSVVCFLLDGKKGEELASASMLNPQTDYGADVISRIQAAVRGKLDCLTNSIRSGMSTLTLQVCRGL